MKRTFVCAVFCIVWIAAMCSCTKEVEQYKGSYSFKAAGSMDWEKASQTNLMDSVYPGHLSVTVANELGQMNVVTVDRKTHQMMVTFNVLGGGVYSVPAEGFKDCIRLDTVLREISYTVNGVSSESASSGGYGLALDSIVNSLLGNSLTGFPHKTEILMTGVGHRYGNVLLFDLEFIGTAMYMNETYKVVQSKVECVAEEND